MTTATARARTWIRPFPWRCLLTALLLLSLRTNAAEVTSCRLVRNHQFIQFGQNTPTEWTPKPFALMAEVHAATGRSVSLAELQRPTGATLRLAAEGTGAGYAATFDLAADLAAAFPAAPTGYTLAVTMDGSPAEQVSLPLPLGSADFPPAPVLLGLGELDGVHPAGEPFLLRWEPFAGARPSDVVQVFVDYLNGAETFRTPGPGETGVLDATRSEVLVPAIAWTVPPTSPGGVPVFQVRVEFLRTTAIDTTTAPGVVAYSGSVRSTASLVTLTTPEPKRDVTDFGVFHGRVFVQSGPDTAALDTVQPLQFEAAAEGRTTDSLRGVALRLPGGQRAGLVRESAGTGFHLSAGAASLPDFDAVYPPGVYGVTFDTAQEGLVEAQLALERNPSDFPTPALLRDYAGAQALDPTRPVTLQSTAWNDASEDDVVQWILTQADGTLVEASAPWPGRGLGDSLNLAANRLEHDRTYRCRIRRFKVTTHDTSTYPGAHGWTGLFTETVCTLRTTPSPDLLAIVSPARQTLPVGVEWIRWIEVEGGKPPLTWTLSGGTPPKGLEFDAQKGRFRGWPAAPGISSLRLRVADAEGRIAEQDLTFEITGEVKRLWVAPTNLPPALGDIAHLAELTSGGGVPPIQWSLAPGSTPLPPGLELDPSTGLIHGVPRQAGTFPFVARVTDASGQTADRELTLAVPVFEPDPVLSITTTELTPAGRLRVRGTVATGTTCTVEGSTDLQDWVSLAAGTELESAGIELPVPSGDQPVFLRLRRGPPEPERHPMSATLRRDPATVSIQVIGPAGGSLQVTNAAGTVMTLALPAGALTEPTEIRMTLLLGLDGAPLSEGWIGGVDLEPEGLVLHQPATLTLESATPLGTNVVVLGYEGDGLDLHDEPAFASERLLRVPVLHFSGHGAGNPGPMDWERIGKSVGGSCRASSRAMSRIGTLLREAKANPAPDGSFPPATRTGLEAAFREWWSETVLPYVDAAKRDESMLTQAVNEYLVWAQQLDLIFGGLESADAFASFHTQWRAKAARGALNAINKLHLKAVTEHVFASAPDRMLAIAKEAAFLDLTLALPGRLEGEVIMERIRRFWRFELAMNADLSSVGRDGTVAFSVAMEGGILELSSEPGNDDRPHDFGAGNALADFRGFPLQRTHFHSTSKDGKGYVPTGPKGELRFHHLTFSRDGQGDGTTPDPGDSSGCPRQHFKKVREPAPPNQLNLLLSFEDPARATINGSAPVNLLINALKGFHETEYFHQPNQESLDLFGFREKWLFTWRALVAEADYNPPPRTGADGATIVEATHFTLKHKPLQLRKSDTEVPPE